MDTSRLREALLIPSALCAVYALAFYWRLDKPFWAAFTVLMLTGLPTLGQTLQKGLLRIAGTLLGALSALSLFALSGGSALHLLVGLSVHVGVTLYLMLSQPQWRYFYYITSFVCLLVVVIAAQQPAAAFPLALARTEENLLGLAVHTVISLIFLQPSANRRFLETVRNIQRVHQKLARKTGTEADYAALAGLQEAAELLLPAVELEHAGSFARRRDWREALVVSERLAEAGHAKAGTAALRARLDALLAYLLRHGPKPPPAPAGETFGERAALPVNPDRFRGPLRVLILFWVVLGVDVLFDPPGIAAMSFVELSMLFVFTELFIGLPSAARMVAPYGLGMAVMFVPYVFVYPLLTSVWTFLAALFGICMALCLLFPGQKYALPRLGYAIPWLALGQFGATPAYSVQGYLMEASIMFSGLLLVVAAEAVLFPKRVEAAWHAA